MMKLQYSNLTKTLSLLFVLVMAWLVFCYFLDSDSKIKIVIGVLLYIVMVEAGAQIIFKKSLFSILSKINTFLLVIFTVSAFKVSNQIGNIVDKFPSARSSFLNYEIYAGLVIVCLATLINILINENKDIKKKIKEIQMENPTNKSDRR